MPPGQQQVLDRIETDLEGCEPRLRSMFAIFARLTRDEGVPRTESLIPGGRRFRRTRPRGSLTGAVRAVIAIPLILALVAFFVFMAISSPASYSCHSAPGMHGPVRAASCRPVPLPPGRS